MNKKTKKLWEQLNNFYNLNAVEQAKLLADLMVLLEEDDAKSA